MTFLVYVSSWSSLSCWAEGLDCFYIVYWFVFICSCHKVTTIWHLHFYPLLSHVSIHTFILTHLSSLHSFHSCVLWWPTCHAIVHIVSILVWISSWTNLMYTIVIFFVCSWYHGDLGITWFYLDASSPPWLLQPFAHLGHDHAFVTFKVSIGSTLCKVTAVHAPLTF